MRTTTTVRSGVVSLALAALLACGSSALAETISFRAELKGANEQPPVIGNATGTVTATYDTASKKLTWTVNYSGLTGNATGAHFHRPGPADNTPDVTGYLVSPLQGSGNLTDAQTSDLTAGRWYFEIETAANPKGEIRGPMQQVK
jgi:Cu/Zn superoxide dismutase